LVNSDSYLKCESLMYGDTVRMLNVSLEAGTEISLDEMYS
jgi:hypothetical protein